MDFSEHISNDIIQFCIIQIDRDIHNLLLYRCVNKTLKYLIDNLLANLSMRELKSIHSIQDLAYMISNGHRAFYIKTLKNNYTKHTYHYVVNCKYKHCYNYHHDDNDGGEYMSLIFYDGMIINISKYSKHSDIIITIGNSKSWVNRSDNLGICLLSVNLIVGSNIANYKKNKLVVNNLL